MRLFYVFLIITSFRLSAQIQIDYDQSGGNFFKSNVKIDQDSIYFYFNSDKFIEYGKLPLHNNLSTNYTITKQNENLFYYTSLAYFGTFINDMHYHNYSSYESKRMIINISGFNYKNSTCQSNTISIPNDGFDPSALAGYLDYVASPFFSTGNGICNVASDGLSKMQCAIVFDAKFNVSDVYKFQLGKEFVKFKQGHYLNGFNFLVFDEFLDIQNPNGHTNTIILKLDEQFNLINGKKIEDLNTDKFDMTPSGGLLLCGRRVTEANQYVMILDNDLDFISGIKCMNDFDFIFRSDPTNSSYGFENGVSAMGNYFIKAINRNGYSVLSKLNNQLDIIWQKVIPQYVDFIVNDQDGGTLVVSDNAKVKENIRIFTIDKNGNSNPGFKEYCGNTFEKSTYYKEKLIPYTDIRNISTGGYSQSIRTVPTTSHQFKALPLNINFTKPEPDFKIDEILCTNECDTIITKDIGAIDSSYYTINGKIVEKLICPDQPGFLEIKHFIEYFGGCIDSLTKVVEIKNAPEVQLKKQAYICDDAEGTAITSMVTGATDIQWSDDPDNKNEDRKIYNSGNYTLIAKNDICEEQASIIVTAVSDIYEGWPMIISEVNETICIGETMDLKINEYELLDSFYWQDGSSDAVFSTKDSALVFVNAYLKGCMARDSFELKFTDCSDGKVFIPNVFSPNYDQINDVLQVNYVDAAIEEFNIYDRWGALMYSEKPYAGLGWDGTFRNKPMIPGVYIYWVRYKHKNNGREEIKKGDVTLMK